MDPQTFGYQWSKPLFLRLRCPQLQTLLHCAYTRQAHLPALLYTSFHLCNKTQRRVLVNFCWLGLVYFGRTWSFLFHLFYIFHTRTHEPTDLHVCQIPFNSYGKKLWVLRLVVPSALSLWFENQVSTTPDTFALCIHSPSTLATFGVHLFFTYETGQNAGLFFNFCLRG